MEQLIPIEDAEEVRKARSRERTKRCNAKKMAAGLCISCGSKPLFTSRLCFDCKEKYQPRINATNQRRRSNHRAAGLCSCGKPKDITKGRCDICTNKSANLRSLRDKKYDELGLCRRCGKLPRVAEVSCERCCTYAICKTTLKNGKMTDDVLDLLRNKQDRLCPYTGIKLYVGVNASIDHKIPKSQGGTHDIDNLVWVHKWANTAKSNLSEQEFLEMVKTVAQYRLYLVEK